MIEISVSDELKSSCPDFVGVALIVKVQNTAHNESLWREINAFSEELKSTLKISDVRHNKQIAATREAYKAFGKDPNRYRPSAEALRRRILRDMNLYQIDTLVDVVNLVSLKTGYSIGGFDFDKVKGNQLILGVGQAEETFEAIGRGQLNIEGLPVYRDEVGGIGTPTSDEERTKLDLETSTLMALINGYSGKEGLEEAVEYTKLLLDEYASSEVLDSFYY